MNICIEYDNGKPMYEQIEEKIKEEIYRNRVVDGEPLPSVRQLSAMLNVSAITVKRAYADLEREGFIYTIAGKGTFIRLKDIERLKEERQSRLKEEFCQQLHIMNEAGITKKEIQEMISQIFK